MIFLYRVNVCCGAKEERVLISGLHTVCDLFCKGIGIIWFFIHNNNLFLLKLGCHTVLGWKYVILLFLSIF